VRKRELMILRLKQVFQEMESRYDDIKNELLSLEECLNLLFPAINSRRGLFSQSFSSSSCLLAPLSRDRDEASKEDLEQEDSVAPPRALPLLTPSEVQAETEPRAASPPKSRLSCLHRDLHHLLANQLKRKQSDDVTADTPPLLPQPSDSIPLPAVCEKDDGSLLLFLCKSNPSADDSEWEDGSVMADQETPHSAAQEAQGDLPLAKRMKLDSVSVPLLLTGYTPHITPQTTSVLDTIKSANLGNLNYTLVLSSSPLPSLQLHSLTQYHLRRSLCPIGTITKMKIKIFCSKRSKSCPLISRTSSSLCCLGGQPSSPPLRGSRSHFETTEI
jgi:hypothetical protein